MRFVVLTMLLAGCEPAILSAVHFDNALIACDAGQTMYASDGGRWDRPGDSLGTVQRELDPILGAAPAGPVVLAAAGFAMIGITSVGYSRLPRWLRVVVLGAVGIGEAYLVATHFHDAGLCGIR